MIATLCQVSTACVEMFAERVEAQPAPPIGRLSLVVAVLAFATVLAAIAERSR